MSSKNLRKVAGGHRARNFGQSFEDHFKKTVEQNGGICVKIPSGGRVVGTGHKKIFVKMKSPFDFVVAKDGLACVLDCKTLEADTFPFSAIKRHQLKSLYECSRHIPSGYVVWFRVSDQVCFFPSELLLALKPRQSLRPQDGFLLGNLKLGFNPLNILNNEK